MAGEGSSDDDKKSALSSKKSSSSSNSKNIPKCHCSWKNCRSWQKTFRDSDHKLWNGVVRIKWQNQSHQQHDDDDDEHDHDHDHEDGNNENNDNNNSDSDRNTTNFEEIKKIWDRVLKVDESKRSDKRYFIARHHFTEPMVVKSLKDKKNWNWLAKCSKQEAQDLYGSISFEKIATAASTNDGDETLYFKLPLVPKDRVKAIIMDVRAKQKETKASSTSNGQGPQYIPVEDNENEYENEMSLSDLYKSTNFTTLPPTASLRSSTPHLDHAIAEVFSAPVTDASIQDAIQSMETPQASQRKQIRPGRPGGGAEEDSNGHIMRRPGGPEASMAPPTRRPGGGAEPEDGQIFTFEGGDASPQRPGMEGRRTPSGTALGHSGRRQRREGSPLLRKVDSSRSLSPPRSKRVLRLGSDRALNLEDSFGSLGGSDGALNVSSRSINTSTRSIGRGAEARDGKPASARSFNPVRSLTPPVRPGSMPPQVFQSPQPGGAPPIRMARRVTSGLATMSTSSVKDDLEKQEKIKQLEEQEIANNSNRPKKTVGGSRYGDDDDGPMQQGAPPSMMRGAPIPLNENRMKRRVTSGLNVMNTLSVANDVTKQSKIKQIEEENKQPAVPLPPPLGAPPRNNASSNRFGESENSTPAFVMPPLVGAVSRHGEIEESGVFEIDEEDYEELVNERDELRMLNSNHEATINDLTKQIKELKAEILDHVEREEKKNDELDEMEDRLALAYSDKEDEVHMAEYTVRMEMDEMKLRFEEMVTNLKSEMDTLKTEHENARVAWERQLEEEREKAAMAIKEAEETKSSESSLKNTLLQRQDEVISLKDKISQLEKKFRDSKQTAFNQTKDLEDMVGQLKKEKEMLTGKALQLAGKNAGNMLRIQELEDKLAQMEYGSMTREASMRQMMEKEQALQKVLATERERRAMITAHMYFAKRSLKKMTSEKSLESNGHNGRSPQNSRNSQSLRASQTSRDSIALDNNRVSNGDHAIGHWAKLAFAVGMGQSNFDLDEAGEEILKDTLPEELELERKMA